MAGTRIYLPGVRGLDGKHRECADLAEIVYRGWIRPQLSEAKRVVSWIDQLDEEQVMASLGADLSLSKIYAIRG